MEKCKWFMVAGFLWMISPSFAQFGPQGGGPPAGEQRRQQPRDPEKVVEEEVKWMKKKLKLTSSQIASVTHVSAKYAYEQDDLRRAAMGTGRPSPEIMERTRDRMKQLGLEKDVEMRKVLDDKQYKKYLKRREDTVKEMESNNTGRPNGPGGGGRPAGGGGRSF